MHWVHTQSNILNHVDAYSFVTSKRWLVEFTGAARKGCQNKSMIPNGKMTSPPEAGNSGADRARTDDLLHAMQALSQLSYGPKGIEKLALRSWPWPGCSENSLGRIADQGRTAN